MADEQLVRLKAQPDKSEYQANIGKMVRAGRYDVYVVKYEREGRSGSYERGLKFSTTTYGGLYDPKKHRVSFDHGKTWHACYADVSRLEYGGDFYWPWKNTPLKDRVRLKADSRKEFAFDGIQAINKQYDPKYKWRP